jgi:hypothetical protein
VIAVSAFGQGCGGPGGGAAVGVGAEAEVTEPDDDTDAVAEVEEADVVGVLVTGDDVAVAEGAGLVDRTTAIGTPVAWPSDPVARLSPPNRAPITQTSRSTPSAEAAEANTRRRR